MNLHAPVTTRFPRSQSGRSKPRNDKRRERRRQFVFESLELRVVLAGTLHNVAAAMIDVVQNDRGNTTASVTVTAPYAFNDFRIRSGSNRADFNVQIGPSATDDLAGGIIMASIPENGRDNGEGSGTLYGAAAIDYERTGANAGVYWLLTQDTTANRAEYNFDVAAAYFPYGDGWYGGLARNATAVNGGANNLFTGTPGLALGTHFKDLGNGQSTVDLTSFGINSQTSGVLLATHGKNEGNFALTQAQLDGTWKLVVHDNYADGAGGEQDPVAFVYVPLTETPLIAGKFLGNLTDAFGRSSPPYTVTNPSTGVYRLSIPGHSPTTGVLIISAETGGSNNSDNVVSYQVNGDSWDIQTRDLPNSGLQNGGALDPIVSFAFIPGPTPGFTATPASGLLTTESGGTATFTVTLDTKPTADVTIGLASSNLTEGTVSPATLTFTSADWNTPQTVTVTGQDDLLEDGSIAYTIVLDPAVSADPNYSGRDPSDVAVLNADNEIGVTVNPLTGLTTTEVGGTAAFTVRLNVAPTAEVVIGLATSDPTEGTLALASLTFTPADWSQPQTVTVTGVDDPVDDGDMAYTIVTAAIVSADVSYHGFDPSDVAVSNIDNDATGITLAPRTTLTTTEAGGTASFSLVLTSQPAADVTVTLASSDTSEGTVAPASLTFTAANWNVPQTATVTGVDDPTGDGNVAFTIVTTVTSGDAAYQDWNLADVSVTNLDNDPLVGLTPSSLAYGIGMPATTFDRGASVTDPVAMDYDTGTLTVAITANADAGDRLEIRHGGVGAGQVGVSGNNVTYAGTTVGTWSGGAGAAPLVVAFNAAATPAIAQAVLRAVTYHNVGSNPPLVPRTVSVVLTNGDGGSSNTATRTVLLSLPRVMEFQEGVDYGFGPYAGTADIQVSENAPTTPYPQGSDASGLLMDWPDLGATNAAQTLLRFDNLFGGNPGQIPPGATIVSAELLVTVNNTGDGGKAHRMLIPWDASNETWNEFGSGVTPRNAAPGVQADNVEARLAYDSQLGVIDGTGATGTGTVSLGVTPDLQAWSAGAANHGWLFTGWTDRTDGTQFSPSESTVVANRPRLRVTWLPAGTPSASFRQGTNGYFGAADTQLLQADPYGDQSASVLLYSDAADNSNERQILLQFGELVGAGASQIPAGSQVHSAVLTLGSTVSEAMGDGGRFYPLLMPWTEARPTWDAWGNGIQSDGIEAAATPSLAAGNASLSPDVQGAFNPLDVTADVQAWVDGTRANYGWAILPWAGGNNEWGFASSEAFEGDPALGWPNERPQLAVFYTAPGITVEPTAGLLTSEAGRTASFAIQLDTPPSGDVTIGLSSDNAGEGTVSPASLTFTAGNWNLPQIVTVAGVDDAFADGAVSYMILTAPAVSADPAYNDLNAPDVAALNLDDDSAGIAVEPLSGLTTSESGGTAAFTVVLTLAPTDSVTIGLASSDTTEGAVSPDSLVFTPANWNLPQAVTVTGADDLQIDGPVAYTIVTAPAVSNDLAYEGLDTDNVAATNLDNDAAGFVVTPASGLVTTEAGATATFTVALTAQPSDSVSFSLSSSNTLEGAVSPPSLTFAPGDWDVPQTVTVTGVNDFIDDGAVLYSVVLEVASSSDVNFDGLNPSDVSVMNLDVNPKVMLPGGETRWGLGDPGIGIDGQATLVDLDSANFNGGTLTVQLTGNGTADDRLEIRNEGTGAGQIGLAGGSVTYGGAAMGTVAGGVGTTPLTVALNAAATPAAMQALLRAVTFRNVAVVPSLNSRTVQVTLTDGSGGASVPASKTVSLGLKRVYQFQEGVDRGFASYTGAADTQLFQGQPGTAYPTGNSSEGLMVVADAGTNSSQVLLRFDGLFGTGAGQIPPGSLITAASLVLDVNNGGNGPRFHRLLTGWDANADTWSMFGNGAAPRNATGGVQADGAEARTAFDATLNVAGGAAAATGVGSISLGVTADVQAWSDGAANHGWVLLPPLAASTDNFSFSPAEAANLTDRPLLRVEWVPAGTRAASFRQGVGGYLGTVDTQLSQNAPTANNSAIVDLFSDWTDNTATPNETQVLLRFDDIIGTGVGQVPSGSTVHAAVLTLPGMGSNNTPGDGGKFHTLLVPWAATDNWSTFTDGVQANGVEARTAYSAVAGYAERNPNAQAGIHNYEVTADVQQWLDGTQANYGWAVLPWPGGSDGWAISSAETANAAYRPQLSLYYSPPPGITVGAPSSPTTSENGVSATFTVVLNAQPTADVSIAVTSSDGTEGSPVPGTLTFTSLNWNQPQIVTVTGLDDALRDGAVGYTVEIAAAVSADARYQGIDAPDLNFTNLDNDTPGITVSAPSGPSTTEAGGTVTFTIVLDSQPAADVTVGLSSSDATEGTVSPASATFTSANWATPQLVTVTGVDDPIADGNVAYTMITAEAVSGDGDYSGLNAADVSLTNLNDDATGGSFGPGNLVVVRVGDGVAGLVNTGSAVFLDEYTPSGTYVRSIALPTTVNGSQKQLIASGVATSEGLLSRSADGQYLLLAGYAANLGGTTSLAGTASATVNRTVGRVTADGQVDTSTALTDFSDGNNPRGAASTNGTDLWMTGGAGGVRHAALGSATSTQLSTTVTNLLAVDVFGGQLYVSTASGSTVRIGTVGTGTPTTAGQTIANLPGFPSSGGGPYGFFFADLDPGVAGVDTLYVADDTALALGKYSLVSSSWVSNGTLGADADDYRGLSGVVDGTTVTLYATRKGGGAAAGGGELVAITDASGYNGAFAGTPTLLATAGANTAFRGVALAPVALPGVTVNPTSGSTAVVEAGATDSYTVVLNAQPTADVTITVAPGAQLNASPTALTFTPANWDVAQTVTVTAVDDAIDEGNHAGTITHAAASSDANYNGLAIGSVTAQIADNDTAGIKVNPTSGLTTTEAGGTATFTIVLDSQPTADVTIGLSSSNVNEGTVAPASVTFTAANWSEAQTVTVTGVDDALLDGDVALTVNTAAAVSADAKYNGLDPANVSVTNTDNEGAAAAGITVEPTEGLITAEDGTEASFTVVLDSQPVADVTIALSSDNPNEGTVEPRSLTFTAANWDVPQSVVVIGADDGDEDGDIDYTVVTAAAVSADPAYSGMNAADVAVLNLDDDAPHFSTVVGRHVFYNRSAWDGNNAAANAADDAAIAPPPSIPDPTDPTLPGNAAKQLGKAALLPGQTATFANYTSYSLGLNGIMVDIAGLPGPLGAADFRFYVGNDNNVTSWPAAPAPQSISVRPGAGIDGSDRVTLIWADENPNTPAREPGAISKQWLRVVVLANANTGLAADDTFYFGNAIGETGNSTSNTDVDVTDQLGARNHPHTAFSPAPLEDAFDFNRDQSVDVTDQLLARNHPATAFDRLQLIAVPVGAGALAAMGAASGASGSDGTSDGGDVWLLPASSGSGAGVAWGGTDGELPAATGLDQGRSDSGTTLWNGAAADPQPRAAAAAPAEDSTAAAWEEAAADLSRLIAEPAGLTDWHTDAFFQELGRGL